MSTRRIIIAIVLALLAFLGIYTWNQRTGQWDWLAANTGLEVAGGVGRAGMGCAARCMEWATAAVRYGNVTWR